MKIDGNNIHKGFTLVELLVVMAIVSFAATAAYKSYVSQQRSSVMVTELTATAQNARGAGIFMHRDVRMAGYGLSDFPSVPAFEIGVINNIDADGDGDSDDTIDTNNDPDQGGADAILLRFILSSGLEIVKYMGAANNLRVCTPSGFEVGDVLFIASPDGQEFRTIEVTQIAQNGEVLCPSGTADKINFSPGLSDINYPAGLGFDFTGGDVFKILERCFFINPDENGNGTLDDPALMFADNYSNPGPLAENIEDLQVVYIMKDGSETTNPADVDDISRLRITILSRTNREFQGLSSKRPTIEDHPEAGASDGFRRRQLTSVSVVRNLNL